MNLMGEKDRIFSSLTIGFSFSLIYLKMLVKILVVILLVIQ